MGTFFEEVTSGDRRRALRAIRRMLAERIAAGPRPRELAALSRQLMQVMHELDEDELRITRVRRRR
jgi:hypothetical protein